MNGRFGVDAGRAFGRFTVLSGLIQAFWAAVEEPKLCYHNPTTILLAAYPYYGNFNSVP